MKELPFISDFLPQPTPVHELKRLSEYLGGRVTLTVKRDDLTVLPMGGNKTRKLAYLMHDALQQGAEIVLTTGALQSNHCRQTAAAARILGLKPVLLLAGEPPSRPTGNLLLDRLMDAEIRWTTRERRQEDLESLYLQLKSEGRKPYLIPYGGSNPLGASAYAYALRELVEIQGVVPDAIVFASSSGGTQAGLVAGAKMLGYHGQIVGISVDEPEDVLKERVANLASAVTELLGQPMDIHADEIVVIDEYAKPGYGVMTEKERNAILTCARVQGLLVDPVYTGRAMAALMDLVRNGYFSEDSLVLFWHTGGTPALFAEPYSGSLL